MCLPASVLIWLDSQRLFYAFSHHRILSDSHDLMQAKTVYGALHGFQV